MDVVGETIRRLKGTIRVRSEADVGTSFTIQLPTTVGVSRALLVEVRGKTFAIPMQAVQQIQRIDPMAVTRGSEQPKICIGKKAYSLIDLKSYLQLSNGDEGRAFDRAAPMLVIDNGVEEAAIIVDSILGSRDIVIKTF